MIRLLLFASQFCTSFANAIWSFSIVIVLSWLGNHQPTTTLAETMGNNETVWIMNASGTVDEDAHHEVGVSATTAATTTTEQAQDEDDTDPGSFFLVSAFGLVTGLALILGSEPVGAWFDAQIRPPPPPNTDSSSSHTGVMTPRRRQPRQRNHALGILLVGQGLCLLMCGSLTAVAVATTTTNGGLLSWINSSQHYTRPYQILLALMICLLGASAEVLRQTINIAAIQKDLVVAMTMSTKRIRTTNTESRIQQRAQWLSSPTTTTDTCSIVNDKKNNNINNNHKEEGQDDDEDAPPPPPNQLQQQSQPHYQYSAHEQHWLTHVNVIMRQLDLICKILGPVVAGWFLKDLSSSSSSSFSGADDSNDTDDDDDDNNNNNRTRTIMIWIPLLTASCSVVLIALQSMFLNQLFVRTPSLQYSSSNPIVDDNNDDDEPRHIRTEEEDGQEENEWDDEETESQEQRRQQRQQQQQEQREFELRPSRSGGGGGGNDCTYPQDEEDSGNCCFLERRRRRKRDATTLHKLEQDEEDDFQLLPGSLFSSYCICCRPLMTTFGCSSSSTTEYCRMPLAAVGAGLALAFLYLNPLSLNDPLVVPYLLLKTNLTATSLGLWEGCNNLFGFVGTLAFWVATSTLSATTDRTLALTNLYSVAFFFLCITVTYASLWCVEAAHSDSSNNNDDDGTKDSDASSSSSSLSASSWTVWILAGSLCLSRSALWAFDLSVNQTIQEAVVRDSLAQRARIGSIQNSLQAIFDCLQYALGCIASNPNQFVPILATIGYGTVGFAVVLVWIVLPPPSSLEVESQRRASPHSSLSNGVALAWCRCRQWICGNRVSLSLQTHPPHGKWQFVSGTEEQGEEEDVFVNELTIPHTAATRRSSFPNYSSCNHHSS